MNFLFAESPQLLALAEYSLKGLLILSLAFSAVLLMRKTSASSRHFVLLTAVAAVLLTPLFSLTLPRLELQLLPQVKTEEVYIPLESGLFPIEIAHELKTEGSFDNSAPLASELPIYQQPGPIEIQINPLLTAVWIIGMLAAASRLLYSSYVISRAVSRSETADSWLYRILEELKRELNIRSRIRLKISDSAMTPFTQGLFNHTIVLPLEEISNSATLRSIMLHELAHIKRSDNLTQRFAQILCIIQWFNPFTWLVARQMMKDRELACDNLVINMGTQASAYASNLVNLARKMKHLRRTNLAAAAIVNSNNFKERIMSILATNSNRKDVSKNLKLITVFALALLAIPLALLQNATLADTETEPANEPVPQNLEEPVFDDVRVMETGHAIALGFKPSHPNIVKIKGTFLGKTVYFRNQGNKFTGLFTYGNSIEPGTFRVTLEMEDKDGKTFRNIVDLELTVPEDERGAKPNHEDQQYSLQILESIPVANAAPPWHKTLLTPVEGRISSYFGSRRDRFTGKMQNHNGVDIAADHGAPVRAALEGRVVLTKKLGEYGNTVVLDHGGGMGTVYAHLESWTIKKGDLVKKGDLIGKVGNSGKSTGPHLHWSLLIDDVALNPLDRTTKKAK